MQGDKSKDERILVQPVPSKKHSRWRPPTYRLSQVPMHERLLHDASGLFRVIRVKTTISTDEARPQQRLLSTLKLPVKFLMEQDNKQNGGS